MYPNNLGVPMFSVRKSHMIETAMYDPLYLSPYQTKYDNYISAQLTEATQNGQQIDETTLSTVSHQILVPTAQVGQHDVANLVNGFDTKRLSFMIDIVPQGSNLGGGIHYVLTGYTDHYGVGERSIDPNMKLFFNAVYQLRDTQVPTPHGFVTQTNIVKSQQILLNNGSNNMMQYAQPQFTLRPEDIAQHLEFQDNPMLANIIEAGGSNGRARLVGAVLSDRGYASRPKYLTKSIKAYKAAAAQGESYEAEDTMGNSVWDATRTYLREEPMSSNRVLMAMMGIPHFKQSGYLTYSEMCSLFPDFDHQTNIVSLTRPQRQMAYQPGQAESWSASTNERIAATIIMQGLPAIMSDCLMTSVTFQATNDTIGGMHEVQILEVHSFVDNLDLTPFMSYFIERVQRELLVDISRQGGQTYMTRVSVNMLYDSRIDLSLDRGPMTPFAAPSFCDSLYSPVVTNNLQTMEAMSYDLSTMLMNINGSLSNMIAQPPIFQGSL